MTNLEMHKDLILNLVHTEYNDCLSPFAYAVASFCGSYDWEVMLKWLFSEYEPKLLENGDGLKVGDWIMVRDEDEELWFKTRFVCYYKSTFFVVDDNRNDNFNENGTNITGWGQARLPMEGE